MRDPRVEPRAGDEFRFDDGEVVKVTSANKWWVKFESSELGKSRCRTNRFREAISEGAATTTIIHAEGE